MENNLSDDLGIFKIETEALAGILETLDYFQVLKIPQNSSPADIKAAYYRESRMYHPDRVFHLHDEELKFRVNTIYKRVTEAYTVLRSDERRGKYTIDINGPDREKKLRFDEISEQEQKKSKEEEIGTTPNGRKFYGAGLTDLQAGRYEAAERNFKMALMYEPNNKLFKQRLEESAKKIKPKDFTVR